MTGVSPTEEKMTRKRIFVDSFPSGSASEGVLFSSYSCRHSFTKFYKEEKKWQRLN